MGATLEEVAAELYGLALADFTARRAELAKDLRAQDKELAATVARLPKPVLAAWAVNHFARKRADELEDLMALGEKLREAQDELAGERMKALTANATAVVLRALKGVAALATHDGSALGDAVLVQVEQTLRAALADPGAAAAVQAGVLVKPLASGGFGPVDLTGAVAVAPADAPPRPSGRRLSVVRPNTDDRRREAQRAAEAALAALERAEADVAERERDLRTAQEQHEAAARQLAGLRADVERAEQAERAAAAVERDATKGHELATRASAKAAEAAQRAQRAVDALS